MATSTTLTSASPDSGTGWKPRALSAWMNDIGMLVDALRKNRPRTSWPQASLAKAMSRSHRGRSSGCGRRPRIEVPSVASMFSPSTRRYVSTSASSLSVLLGSAMVRSLGAHDGPGTGQTPMVRLATKPLPASPVTVASWWMPPSSPKTLSEVSDVCDMLRTLCS